MTRSTANQSAAGSWCGRAVHGVSNLSGGDRHPLSPWSEPVIAYALKHWNEGRSAKDVADMLDRQFGVKLSRSAVIGKMHRLGGKVERKREARNEAVRLQGRATRRRAMKAAPVVAAKPVLAVIAQPPLVPPPDPIPLMARTRSQCAWPVETPDRPANQLCCGAPVQEAVGVSLESYCATHGKIARNRNTRIGKPNAKALIDSARRYA